MRILSESTPRSVRWVLAPAGLVLLVVVAFACYAIGYGLAQDGWPIHGSEMTVVGYAVLVGRVLLLGALAVATVLANLRRPWRDAWIGSAMPASMLLIGFVVETARSGF